jgi:hypothetical protein
MKNTTLLLIASLLLVCCKTGTASVTSLKDAEVTSACPVQTDCKFEILKDKSLDVKTDDTGHTYYNLKAAPGKTVFKYTHKKITDSNLMDAGYSETIIFESDDAIGLNHSGADVQKVKMLFNVACFCRGKAGIYTVKEGTLSYKDNKLHIEIPKIVDGQMTGVVDVVVK